MRVYRNVLRISQIGETRGDLFLEKGRMTFAEAPASGEPRYYLLPGLVDAHTHLREPGFSYKETIASGTLAAARGGFTAVCAMPNLEPTPDTAERLAVQRAIIARDACVAVHPFGCITEGERGERLADLEALAPDAVGFSDDGVGVVSDELMRAAMLLAARLDRPISAHCEVKALVRGGCIHDGAYARAHGLPGISSESEWRMVERDLRLAAETGCRYHVCHVSAHESVALIRRAKADGLPVTAETCPHYLALCDDDLRDEGRFKMNPPLRARADRDALREAVADGTIDLIATDHAPHAAFEKEGGLRGAKMGVVGLETALPAVWTTLVEPGLLTPRQLAERMSFAPRRVFRLPDDDGWTLFDSAAQRVVDPDTFASLGRSTPFAGMTLTGEVIATAIGGALVYDNKQETL